MSRKRCAASRFRTPRRALALAALSLCGCSAGEPRASAPAEQAALAPLLRIAGDAPRGELGFRFGPPRDVDGDGIADVAAGSRYTALPSTGMGAVSVWSTAGGRRLARWHGEVPDALFGHCVVLHPDIDGDSRADIVAAAPNGKYDEVARGAVSAMSAAGGRKLWTRLGGEMEAIGWQLAVLGDLDGDGIADIAAGSPGGARGKVVVLSGRDGAPLRAFTATGELDRFGWYVAGASDFDGDGHGDLLVGAPSAPAAGNADAGAAYLLSTRDGKELHVWLGGAADGQLGEVVAAVPDLDGDGRDEVAIGAPGRPSAGAAEQAPGDAFVFAGATDRLLWRWRGRQRGELYGRMIAAAGDADGDGIGDIAVGAPWHRSERGDKIGRVEIRSGKSGEVIAGAEGNERDLWMGWHLSAGEDLGERRGRGLVASSLLSREPGLEGAGAIHVYLYPGR